MHWLIKCRSKPNTDALREATLEAHCNFLDGYPDVTWFSGPLFTDDNSSAIGSLLIFDVADKAEVETFWADEPFNLAGIYEWVTIERWRFGHV